MRSARPRLVFFSAAVLAALTAVLAILLPSGIASATGRPAAETRVWAFSQATHDHVRADQHVSADQSLGEPAWCPFWVSGSCVAPEAGSAAVRDFAHGTSIENAQSILNNGLNEGAARAVSMGGRYAQRGSFFSFEVTPANTEGLQLAYEMGLRQGGECVVLVCRLPASTVSELENAGLARTGSIPGVNTPETVFSPGAFARINEEATWQLIKP